MHSRLPFKLAFRFLNSKRYGSLAKFISFASTAGICTGVCALIIGLSAMNGFEYELNNRVLSLIPGATLTSFHQDGFANLQENLDLIKKDPHIVKAAPVVSINGAFCKENNFAPAMLLGIDTELEKEVISLERFMSVKVDSLKATDDYLPVIIGSAIASDLNLQVNDTIDFASVDNHTLSNGFSNLSTTTFKIVGLFKTGGQIDHNFAFIELNQAVALAKLKAPNSIHLKLENMLEANTIAYNALGNLTEPCKLTTWIDTQGKLYHDINMIRKIMYIAMFLIIGVACFNIISNLTMAASEKKKEIAILKTMGASSLLIIKTFTWMGLLSAFKGCTIGGLLGCVIALLTPFVTAHFKAWFGFELLNENVYFINFIPTKLSYFDVLLVIFCATFMSTLASIYPALKASKVDPAKELSM